VSGPMHLALGILVRQVLVKDRDVQAKMLIDSVEIGTAQIKAAPWAAQFAAILLQFHRAVRAEAQCGAAIGINSSLAQLGTCRSDRVRCRTIHAR